MIKTKEEEIRPKAIFDQYLRLCRQDIETYFRDSHNFVKVNCPACGSNTIQESFTKNGFTYNWCAECRTLYVSPLPPEENFRKYYEEAKSVEFWATDFYKHTEKARKEKIFQPRVELIEHIFRDEFKEDIEILVDIGAGFGSFCELAKKSCFFQDVIAIEPSPPLIASLKNKNIFVIEKFMEEVTRGDFEKICPDDNKKKLFCAFELWEHLYNPSIFLQSIKKVMHNGDYLLITTLNILGFDLLILWERSKSISPPHHINLFNLESLKQLLKNNGLKIKKALTPGKLDVDILKNMNISSKDRLLNYVINESSEEFRHHLQEFISKNDLSSHMMVIAHL